MIQINPSIHHLFNCLEAVQIREVQSSKRWAQASPEWSLSLLWMASASSLTCQNLKFEIITQKPLGALPVQRCFRILLWHTHKQPTAHLIDRFRFVVPPCPPPPAAPWQPPSGHEVGFECQDCSPVIHQSNQKRKIDFDIWRFCSLHVETRY